MNVLDLLQDQMTDGLLESLTKQVGGQNKEQTAVAAQGIFSTLTAALAKNAASPEGRSALASALDRDHDGSVLDDIMGMVAGQTQSSNNRATNGMGILKHVLGGKQDNASSLISKMSGMDQNSTLNLMATLAPMVMGALGKQKRQASLDEGGIASLLSNTVKSSSQSRAEMSIVEKFLDQDGDGSIMDDLLNMGGSVLGNFFKK